MGELLGKMMWLLGLGGIAMIGGGVEYEEPKVTVAGFLLLGLVGILAGIRALLDFRVELGDEETGRKTYIGIAAIPAGVLLLLFATIEIVLFAAVLTDRERQLFEYIRGHVGVLWLVLGAIFACIGLRGLMGTQEENASRRSVLRSIPGRLGDIVLLVLGVAACVVGITAQRAPATYVEWTTGAWSRLPEPAQEFVELGEEVGGAIVEQALKLADRENAADTTDASGNE